MNTDNSICWLTVEYLRSLIIGGMPQWFVDWVWLFLIVFVLVNSIGVYWVVRCYHPMFSGWVGMFICGLAIYLCWIVIPVWLGWVLVGWVCLVDIAFPSAVIVE